MLTQFATATNGINDKIWYRKYVNGTWSDWDYIIPNSDFPVVGKLMFDGGKRLRLQVERYADGNLYIAAYNNDTNTGLGSVKLT
jgi:hypothetical protein